MAGRVEHIGGATLYLGDCNGHGKPVRQNGLRRNWWIISNPYTVETDGHPAPMPFSLALDHIETWTTKAQTVLDPFMGSGTTGVACAKLGRKFIGIEINETYFEIACKRIEEAYDQPDLFIEPPAPKQVQPAPKQVQQTFEDL